ncbi:hypothetical protein Agub_g12893, partial [Astrephomene gubernaculifera]
MSVKGRSTLLVLALKGTGLDIKWMGYGLRTFLEPYLESTHDGRYYLKDGYQRLVLQVLIKTDGRLNPDGSLRDLWNPPVGSVPYVQLLMWWCMLLGNVADRLFGSGSPHNWAGKRGPYGNNNPARVDCAGRPPSDSDGIDDDITSSRSSGDFKHGCSCIARNSSSRNGHCRSGLGDG